MFTVNIENWETLMKKPSSASRRYDRQFNMFAEEYGWLKKVTTQLGLSTGQLQHLSDDVLSRAHLDESIGLVKHLKRGECSVKAYALDFQGEILGRLYPANAFVQSLAVVLMRMLGYEKYRPNWTLREGVKAFIETRQITDYRRVDVTDDVRHLLVVSEWTAKYNGEPQSCLEVRILNLQDRSLSTLVKQSHLRSV